MKYVVLFLAGFFAIASLASCAAPTRTTFGPIADPLSKVEPPPRRREPPKNVFVLIEDHEGKTGRITVGNKEGTQDITRPGLAAEVKDAASSPAPPTLMSEEEINRIFGAALSALPRPPLTFTLYFKNGSTDFTEEYAKGFPSVLAAIDARKSREIVVTGHADRVGTRQRNYDLSRNRAQRVKEILTSKGIDPEAVETEWHGEDEPLVKTDDEVAEPRNRRVEVTVR